VVKARDLGERFTDTSGIPGFLYWRKFCAESPHLNVGNLMAEISGGLLTEASAAAYQAPFPDDSYLAGARRRFSSCTASTVLY
jgi:hypothetical protein